jgi:2-phosphosulfolactate phosphatase
VKLFIYHTPELVPSGDAPDCAIAVDVLRATTTMATALNNGAEAVQVFSDINQLMQVSNNWPADRRIRIGERGGKKVDGCDEGNSPLALTPEVVKDKRIFISTTNGTRSLERVAEAKAVLAGALINRQAVVNYLLTTEPASICIVGSGWEGSFSLEDTVCAGAIADGLIKELGYPVNEIAGNDEVYAAIALYLQWENNLYELLCRSTHGQRLLGLECLDDLKYCSQTDILDILPKQKEPGVLVKG